MPLITNVLRPKDLLHVQFEFVNLELDAANPGRPRLRRTGTAPAVIVIRLPPQHIAEAVVGDNSSQRLPYAAFLSCPSRIAFRVPANVREIPFTVDAILASIAGSELIAPGAALDAAPATVIEFPDRLLMVPEPDARLFHRATLATSGATQRTAIWHTRIGVGDPKHASRFRAVSNPVDRDGSGRPFTTTLSQRNRRDIVARSLDDPLKPYVIASSRFMLSSFGAAATLKSAWPPGSEGLQAWDHDSEGGRDVFVRTAEKGFLFPFGHRATLVKITQRDFASHSSVNVAELYQRSILLIEETERDFHGLSSAYPAKGREMPLKRIRIEPLPISLADERDPVPLTVTATDLGDILIACDVTVLFVPSGEATNLQFLKTLRDRYKAFDGIKLGNQLVTLAEDATRKGGTSLNVETLTIGVKIGDELQGRVIPPFLPFMVNAGVKIPALEQFLATGLNRSDDEPRTTTITLHDSYLRFGIQESDKRQVFAKFAAVPGLKIPAERAGGLAAPTFPDIDGLSRTMGPVSGVDTLAAAGSLSPERLIGETKLLGVIELKKIISQADSAADDFPVNQLESLYDKIDDSLGPTIFLTRPMMTTVKRDSGLETRFLWKPKINQGGLPLPLQRPQADDVQLIIRGRTNKSLSSASAPPTFEIEGKLKSFDLRFSDVITLEFNKLEFKAGGGRKMDVKVDLRGVKFGPALAFVAEIQKLLPLKSLGGAPPIQPQPDGVVVRYSIPIPSLPLGIFNIQNIALSSSVSISFVEGKPVAVRFALSERNNPFIVSASIFGGTGFFALEVRTDGTFQIDAAIEFGGIVSLSLFIIKGAIYLLAGIFLSVRPDKTVLISGYLRFGGYVDVLDLISVSIEFYIALIYDGARNVLSGLGRVTVSVKLIFFSESFSFVVRKDIAAFGQAPGEGLDAHIMSERSMQIADATRARPTMNLDQWRKYCAAFD